MNEKMLNRIQGLLAQAASTNFPEEADTFLAAAHKLMFQYGIEEHELRQKAGAHATKPGRSEEIRVYNPYRTAKGQLLASLAEITGCKAIKLNGERRDEDGRTYRAMILFGFTEDVGFAEMMFSHLLIQLTAEQMAASKDGRSTGAKWQNSFALGWVSRIYRRLDENKRLAEATSGPSTALVLADKEGLVNEALKEEFSRMKNSKSAMPKLDTSAFLAGTAAAETADISGGRGHLDKADEEEDATAEREKLTA
jgi:hypothetical protein